MLKSLGYVHGGGCQRRFVAVAVRYVACEVVDP